MAKKKHKMTAGAASGVGRLEKIGKTPKSAKVEGSAPKVRTDRKGRLCCVLRRRSGAKAHPNNALRLLGDDVLQCLCVARVLAGSG